MAPDRPSSQPSGPSLPGIATRAAAGLVVAALAAGVWWWLPAPPRDDDATRRLVPAALDKIAAIEMVRADALHRFERDADGDWFRHRHDALDPGGEDHEHRADPVEAVRIADALEGFLAGPIAGVDTAPEAPWTLVFVYRVGEAAPAWRLGIAGTETDAGFRTVTALDLFTAFRLPADAVRPIEALLDPAAAEAGR